VQDFLLACSEETAPHKGRFRHHLSISAACLSCNLDEDTNHLLLLYPRAVKIWDFFHRDFDPGVGAYASFSDLCLRHNEESTINTTIG
jgi:hypothetical protein